ncbi:polysaccharide lyase family protein [Streptomyces sp. NBC_01537]|uniref:rhamnogalacturonan lyase B N-terminal domain-containing protein n=1 Tax=Streptomyces sp. NBC_01537 TaxID=2903896 RepID=UPI003862DCCF
MSEQESTREPRLRRRTLLAATGAIGAGAMIEGPLAGTASAAAFGYSDDGTNYVIDTGASLVFKVSHVNGDLTSLAYKGTEYQGFDGKNSHVESGLGASTVTISQSGTTILVKVVHGTLIHYYAARSGENNVYLWTNKADTSVSATRYIVRVKPGLFPNTDPDAWDSTTDTVIEAADVFVKPDGTTRSKHYSGLRVTDYDYIGWSTGSVGLWMVRSNHEKASGGPFYRSLLRHHNDGGGGLYEILYYGENQTEAQRFGLQGPYVIAFTDGGAPASALYARNIDTSWADSLGLTGWTGASGRGRVAGVGISGRDSAYPYTVGLANSDAQFWGTADAGSGYFSIPKVLPGTYTLTVFKGELGVYTGSVTVTAGATTVLNTIAVVNDPATASAIWRIGDWNGTPAGFKNAGLMTYAHPSDIRASAWTGDFTVGSSSAGSFPAYIWKDVNNGIAVYFKLTAAQAAAAHVLRIGISTNYINGRPQVTVNGWTSSVPSPPTEPSTRTLTVGSYRGNNVTFTYSVPASAWLTDTSQYNVLRIYVASGSSGTAYLSPGVSVDAIDLLA